MRRAQIDTGSQPVRNLFTDPSFNNTNGTVAVRTNFCTDPAAETSTSSITLRTNLATNPSFEGSSGTVDVRTNLATNPTFEGSNGTTTVRTNLALNPSAISAAHWGNIGSAAHTRVEDTTVFHEGTSSIKTTLSANGSLGAKGTVSGGFTSGETVSWSVWVYPSKQVTFQPYWERVTPTYTGGNGGAGTVCPANTWTQIKGTITFSSTQADPSGSFGFGAYAPLNEWLTGDYFYMDELMVEKVPLDALGDFFNGSRAASGDFTYAWGGTANASVSNQIGTALSGVGPANQAVVYRTGATGSHEAKVLFKGTTIADSGLSFSGILSVAASKTYTVSVDLTSDIARTVKFSAQGTGTVNQSSANISLAAGVKTRQSWSFTTTATAPTAVAIYILRADTLLGTLNVDDMLIEEGSYVGTYFDGANPIKNLCPNPSFSTTTSPWGANVADFVLSRDDTTGHSGTSSAKVVVNASAVGDINFYGGRVAVSPYEDYTASAYVKTNQTLAMRVTLEYRNSAGSAVTGGVYTSVLSVASTDDFARLSVSGRAPAGAASVFIRVGTNVMAPVGFTYWVDSVLLEKSATLNPYYEGLGDFTYLWAGTANASVSYQRGTFVTSADGALAYAISSTDWAQSGSKSLRVIPNSTSTDSRVPIGGDTGGLRLGLQAGKTYTISATCRLIAPQTGTLATAARSIRFFQRIGTGAYTSVNSTAAPNVAGATRLSITHTLPADATEAFIRLQNGASFGGGDVWWDDLLIEETSTLQPYFDGTSSHQNLITNPSFETNLADWTTIGSTATRITTKGDGHMVEAAQITPANGVRQGMIWYNPGGVAIPAGPYTVSFEMEATDASFTDARVILYDTVGVANRALATTPLIKTGMNRYTFNLTATGNFNRVYVEALGSGIPAGTKLWIDHVLLEKGTTKGHYYEGAGDITYAWTGTVNASSSIQKAPAMSRYTVEQGARIYRDSGYQISGRNSIRFLGGGGDFYQIVATNAPGMWTFSCDYKTDGTVTGNPRLYIKSNGTGTQPAAVMYSLPLTQTTPGRFSVTVSSAEGTTGMICAVFGATTGDIWIDNILIEQGPSAMPYFDGSTPAVGDYTYQWTGLVNASTSQMTGSLVTPYYGGGSHAIRSSEWSKSGDTSCRIVSIWNATGSAYVELNPGASGLTLGKTYTMLATCRIIGLSSYASAPGISVLMFGAGQHVWAYAPKRVGVHQLRLKFTLPVTGLTSYYLRAYNWGKKGDPDVWFDDIMIVEGDYQGDYVDGSKPLAKWDGTVNNSTSVGYPPQLLDIAGKPVIDMVTDGTYSLDDSFGLQEPRTAYTVFETVSEPTAGSYAILQYGHTALSDVNPNTWVQVRIDANPNVGNTYFYRRTNGLGLAKLTPANRLGVGVWGLNAEGKMFSSVDGGTLSTDSQVMSMPHQKLHILAADSVKTHVRTIIYRGYHDDATRAAVSRYLGNKYGGNVA